jgi:hypothetical protein
MVDIHIYVHVDGTDSSPDVLHTAQNIAQTLAFVTQIRDRQEQLIGRGQIIVAALSDISDAVAAESTVVGSAVTLLETLSASLNAAIAANDPAALQAVVDSISTQKDALAAAVVANTPAA